MRYQNIVRATFIDRPNRFVAHVRRGGEVLTVHVKNTGRCRELLVAGCTVLLEQCPNPARKTAFDLVAVYKGARLINMDAAAPNAAAGEWLAAGGLGFVPGLLKPEAVHGDSRFDFYLERAGRGAFLEVKGVTLEERGVVRFPDAPTARGTKHLRGLAAIAATGEFDAYLLFVIQMAGADFFEPNRAADPAFAEALRAAAAAGVHILAMDCAVTEGSLALRAPVEVRLCEKTEPAERSLP